MPYTMEGLINWAPVGGNYLTTDSGQVKRWLIAIIVGGHTDLQFGRARARRQGRGINCARSESILSILDVYHLCVCVS